MSDKLTDEQLREMADKGTVQWRAEVSSMASELIALRADRAKPTQSDEERAHSILQGLPGVAYKEYAISAVVSAFASIRAEGSAERAKLEAACRPFADAHFYYNDSGKPDDCGTGIGGVTYGDFRRLISVLAALTKPAESGATEGNRWTDAPDGYWVGSGTGAKP